MAGRRTTSAAVNTRWGAAVALGEAEAGRRIVLPRHYRQSMVTIADVRALARTLPRSSEHLIRDRVKFRVGSIVYVAFSRDETTMGFAYPREERDALIAGEPDLFFLPGASDLRFNWVCCHLARLDHEYMTELVTDAWRMVVPKFVARQRLGS